MSATRDQVLDALWPELDPEVAINSLNQTLYFLRRVFEENYSEDLSPGYVHHDSDVIWLDRSWSSSRSVECRRLIRDLPLRQSGRRRATDAAVSRAVRPRLRIRGVGRCLSRLAPRRLPGDRRAICTRRLQRGPLRPWHPDRPTRARRRRLRRANRGFAAPSVPRERRARGRSRAVRALRHVHA